MTRGLLVSEVILCFRIIHTTQRKKKLDDEVFDIIMVINLCFYTILLDLLTQGIDFD